MTEPTILAKHQVDTFRGELHYHSEGEPSYTYLKFDELERDMIRRPVALEDWALTPAHQFTHPSFNWHHYLVDNYLLEKINGYNLSELEFERLLDLISPEFEQHHRLACTFRLTGITIESVVSQLKLFSTHHPMLLFDVREQTSPFRGGRNSLTVFITQERTSSSSHLLDAEWESLIQLMNLANPRLGDSLALNLADIKPLSLIDTTYAHYSPNNRFDFYHIHQGHDTIQAYQHRPILKHLHHDTIVFLEQLFKGYPLGVRD